MILKYLMRTTKLFGYLIDINSSTFYKDHPYSNQIVQYPYDHEWQSYWRKNLAPTMTTCKVFNRNFFKLIACHMRSDDKFRHDALTHDRHIVQYLIDDIFPDKLKPGINIPNLEPKQQADHIIENF